MREALRTLMKDEIEQEKTKTIERVTEDCLRIVMKKLGKNALDAMEFLEISESEQEKYLAKLQ